jgi:uncharacterized protein YndB with AHSA1/START domain
MISTNETQISKDPSGKKLIVNRNFNALPAKVWRAWTESALLDQWWAPRPWKAVTRSMDFSEGGYWLYAMTGPAGEVHWCKVDYLTIDAQKSFTANNGFSDEHGNPTNVAPMMHWLVQFAPAGDGTAIVVEITFDSEADLQQIVDMGFKEGFSMGLGNLDELLAKQ